MSMDLVGPFEERRVVLDGWTVPLIQAWEVDGGTVCVVVEDVFAYTIPAGEAENVIRLIANVIASAWGYRCHPQEDEELFVDRRAAFARVPHPFLAPHRIHGIEAVSVAPEEKR